MAGCWVALLFSLVDPYLWIFSSRHRHIHATDSAQKTIQEVDAQRSARERCSAGYRAAYSCSSAVAASLLLMSSRCWPWPPCCVCMQQCRRRLRVVGCPHAAGHGHRAAYSCSSAVAASLLLMSSHCWVLPPCCVRGPSDWLTSYRSAPSRIVGVIGNDRIDFDNAADDHDEEGHKIPEARAEEEFGHRAYER